MKESIYENLEIYELRKPSWDYLAMTVAPDYLEYTNPDVVEHQKTYLITAEVDFDLVGYVFLAPKPDKADTYCLIHALVVPEFREEGIGSELIEYALRTIKRQGVKTIETFCLEDEEEEALPWFEKNSFSKKGDRYALGYDMEKLENSQLHNTSAKLENSIKSLSEISKSDAQQLMAEQGVDIRGMNRELSAALIDEGKIAGYVAMSMTEESICMEGIRIFKKANAARGYLKLLKYTVEKMLEVGKENEIEEVSFRIETNVEAFKKVIGEPDYTECIPVFIKEVQD